MLQMKPAASAMSRTPSDAVPQVNPPQLHLVIDAILQLFWICLLTELTQLCRLQAVESDMASDAACPAFGKQNTP